ncbi:GGDEF domain-containing protein [Ammoniphilus sp. 3BR4]|uniref:GGDEF domain-containing protein n=1 Tax=Ammoniphilus sp. 3BR4 TaxID=3158265 RepID=UPI003467335C
MQRKGRIIGSLFILIHTLYLYLIHDISILENFKTTLTTACFTIVGWIFGFHYDKVTYLSTKDPLTQLYNRRMIPKLFTGLASKCEKNNRCFCLILLDCNNFKSINDTYGHKAGDKVLHRISQILLQNTRRQDVVARWGGDEFLLLISRPCDSDITSFQHHLHKMLRDLSDSMNMDISVSIGISIAHDHVKSLQEMINEADQNLYSQKHTYHVHEKERIMKLM